MHLVQYDVCPSYFSIWGGGYKISTGASLLGRCHCHLGCVALFLCYLNLIMIAYLFFNCCSCMFSGIHDENDHVYCPKIVRIGLKAHHSIKAVSLDELVCGRLD